MTGFRIFIAWSVSVLLVSVLGWSVKPTSEPTVTIYAHPLPLDQYRDEKSVTVRFTYNTHEACSSIEPLADGELYIACYDRNASIIYMPHPCADNRIDQEYTQLMCHELGHANGWTHR